MFGANDEPKTAYHVVALPYPGRGHINPMMNLCKLLSSRNESLTVTFVVTEEWLSLLSSEDKPPENIKFATIPNVLPSEKVRAGDVTGFMEAVLTNMEGPFERVLDRLAVQPRVILADVFVSWVVGVGERRNIPVGLLWPMAGTVFSIFHHFDLLVQNGHFPTRLPDEGEKIVNYIPGLSPFKIADLPYGLHNKDKLQQNLLKFISNVPKAQYLLISSIYELETPVFKALKPKFPFPVYSLGPLIPHPNLEKMTKNDRFRPGYLKWLDAQAQGSVLYVSLGSFLSVTRAQMDEIVVGLCDSGVRFLLVARDNSQVEHVTANDNSRVVLWCDQLRVLCHPSIGGFWTHCGWNSTMESVFAGVPMICFPIAMDQPVVCKLVVDDWKIGWKLKGAIKGSECLVTRNEVSELVKRFMDPENVKRKEMMMRAMEIREICHGAIREGGSSENNVNSFVHDIGSARVSL